MNSSRNTTCIWLDGKIFISFEYCCPKLATSRYRNNFGELSSSVSVVFGVGVGALFASGILRQFLTAELEIRRVLLIDAVHFSLLFLPVLVSTIAGSIDIEIAILILSIASMARCVCTLWQFMPQTRMSTPFDWILLFDVFRYGVKFSFANLLYLLSLEVGVIILRYLLPNSFEDIGIYSRAVSIGGLILIFPRSLGPLLFAKWSQSTNMNTRAQVEATLRVVNTYGLLTLAVVFVFGDSIIYLLYGPAYAEAKSCVDLLALSALCVSNFIVLTRMLAGMGRITVTIYISMATLITMCLSCVILVPSMDIEGAALGTLIGNIVAATAAHATCAILYNLRTARCFFICAEDISMIFQALGSKRREMSG